MIYFTHRHSLFLFMPAPKKRAPVSRRTKASSTHVVPAVQPGRHHNLCQSCHTLPTGSMELMALMLVLVFSLSAVLFTSVYALRVQDAKIESLTQQIQ